NLKILPSKIKLTADELGIPVVQPDNINSPAIINLLSSLNSDLIITAAFGGYLGRQIRELTSHGCFNLHPSLLPKYRGASPIRSALLQGDKFTGITIFRMQARMDAGPVIWQKRIEISPHDCYSTLHDRLAEQGARELLGVIEIIEKGDYSLISQDDSEAVNCRKISRKDWLINWEESAENIFNKIRAFAWKPGAEALFRGKVIKIIKIETEETKSSLYPGSIVEVRKNYGIIIATSDYDMRIEKIQPAGKQVMDSYAFSLGARIIPGDRFNNGI
ncbi:MAG: methionyl-tRNA formyltransferase, partial [Candidatus Cloacimonetes bacterium]|nr:methionyl-tRNA formyltransferase [Candidatus Cloacimonadota bacterium]